jgi:hypothetical protein
MSMGCGAGVVVLCVPFGIWAEWGCILSDAYDESTIDRSSTDCIILERSECSTFSLAMLCSVP